MDMVNLINPEKNRPGIGSRILLAEIKHILTWGAAATLTNFGDELRITGDHVFDEDKGFFFWETEDDIANLKIPIVGASGSLGFKPELTVMVPGLTPANALSAVQNRKFIGMISAFGCGAGQWLQIGDLCNPLQIKPSDGFNSGTAGGNDARGWSMKLGSNYSVAFYEGDITMMTTP